MAARKLRFHLLGLAHLPTRREISPCPYTQKVVKLATMLKALGHTVIFYGGEGSEVACDEFVPVVSDAERRATYGDYDWRADFFRHDPRDRAHQAFNASAIAGIRSRQREGDFLLCSMGNYHRPIADALSGLWVVEPGVGYEGVFSRFRVFESYAWMHYIYGRLGQGDGHWYDAVIPNYFDPADFPFCAEKDDYALYMGRLIKRKGVEVAEQVAERLGLRLIVAGQGRLQNGDEGLDLRSGRIEFVGAVGPERRAALMGRARLLFAPTYYIEPFGGVAVEAQLCGTPVLASDWGAFSETVLHGVTGYRCRTFDDFCWAAQHADALDPLACREWAAANYSLDRAQRQYQEYFGKVADIDRAGWYEEHPEREDLEWLRRYYPPAACGERPSLTRQVAAPGWPVAASGAPAGQRRGDA